MTPQNQMQQFVARSKSSDRNFDFVLAGWLRTFSRIYRHELMDDDIPIYADLLSDLNAEMLTTACRRAVRVCRFFPTVADIRAQIDDAAAKCLELEAETQWQELLAWTQRNVYPDTGISEGAPKLTPEVEHAARAAGGVRFLEHCTVDQLVWCRKTFIAAYKNVCETEQVEQLLGERQAKQILATLSAGPPEESRVPAPTKVKWKRRGMCLLQANDEPTATAALNEDWMTKYPPAAMHTSSTGRRVSTETLQEITDAEWDQRKQKQKDHLNVWLAEHTELQKSPPEPK
jgi:hypothetical protein